MNLIAWHFEASPTSNDHQVRPVVDDADFLRMVAGDCLGIDPPEFFRQPALGASGKLLIGRCSCGVVGCRDVLVDVSVVDQSITWQGPESDAHRFDLEQYLDSFECAATNTAWESVGRTAERLVSSLDFTSLEGRGYRFEWASTRVTRGRITLSFLNNGTQRLFGIGWNEQQAEDAEQQVRRWVAQYA
jgi:hypothetical protein